MRCLVVILLVVQMLMRGAAVSHAHDGHGEPDDHANRAHLHVFGPSHSRVTGHEHPASGHSHRHHEQPLNSDSPEKPDPADPSPLSSDHDQDAIYIGSEPLAAPLDRIQVPMPTDAEWIISDFGTGSDAIRLHLIDCRSVGPPDGSVCAPIELLPHLLRV